MGNREEAVRYRNGIERIQKLQAVKIRKKLLIKAFSCMIIAQRKNSTFL
jgi:hypothetical protein